MKNKYILTAFCKDRPGIVAEISQVLFENGYNLEDSSMMYLADEFAMLLLLSAPLSLSRDEVLENLSSECRRLEREKRITAYIRPVSKDVKPQVPDELTKKIIVEGQDHSGIVFKVSNFLAASDLNIRTLNSKMKPSPGSGEIIYRMTIVVEIPEHYSVESLREGLDAIGDELNVDVALI